MKKILKLALVIVMLISIASCFFKYYNYDGWKTVEVRDEGTIKIPNNWQFYEEDGLIYIVDENSEPVMIETRSNAGFEEGKSGNEESNKYFNSVIYLQCLTSNGLSNSAIYGKDLMMKDDEQMERFFIRLGIYDCILLIVWDDTLDEEFIEKIAYSYSLTGR